MTLTFIDLYNDITGQAWSMFDSETENKEEFEKSVTTSIQKALTHLWFEYEYEFRKKYKKLTTRVNKIDYALPFGQIDNKDVYCENETLCYLANNKGLEDKIGKPEYFYIIKNKICLYPVPDNVYIIDVGYLSMLPACDKFGEEKANLIEETDYINIDETYEDLFKNTLLPLAMMYLIASESDENYSAYQWQYENALKKLKKNTSVVKKERVIGW